MHYSTEIDLPSELCFNIWFIVDIGTNLSTHCLMKSYSLAGNDEEKLHLLTLLAAIMFTIKSPSNCLW